MPKYLAVLLPSAGKKRRDDWRNAFGALAVPVTDSRPHYAQIEIGRHLFYAVDVAQLTDEQRQNCALQLARDFGMPVEEVLRDQASPSHGIPILACDVVVIEEEEGVELAKQMVQKQNARTAWGAKMETNADA